MTVAAPNPAKVAKLPDLRILRGSHAEIADAEQAACAMELVSWLSDEPFSAAPQCACPVITRFVVNWNDSLPTDEDRARVLGPFLERIVGSRSTPAVEKRRSYMALDWSIRVSTPAWIDLAGLVDEAAALRALPEIVNSKTATASHKSLNAAKTKASAAGAAAGAAAWAAARAAAWDAARDAAWAAAGAAAWDAARDAAWDAARDAAWDAARDAAWDAAWAAAGAAARAAARDAAWAAAGAAARDAARDALAPTAAELQQSANELLDAMINVTEAPTA